MHVPAVTLAVFRASAQYSVTDVPISMKFRGGTSLWPGREHYQNYPRGLINAPPSGGQIFRFSWGPPLGNWKIFCLRSGSNSVCDIMRGRRVNLCGSVLPETCFYLRKTGFCHNWSIFQIPQIDTEIHIRNKSNVLIKVGG